DLAMTLHDLDMHHFSQYWKRGVRTGHAYAEVAQRFRGTDDALWSKESNNALRDASLLVGTPLAAAVVSAGLRRTWPLAAVGVFWAAVIGRTVNRGLWKSPDLNTRVLYAFHSHFQKVPISWGQLLYRSASRRGDRKTLIEYK
ncbi:MAG: glycosyltransferase family 2 protein, partial [Acidimicrobiales bacterium]